MSLTLGKGLVGRVLAASGAPAPTVTSISPSTGTTGTYVSVFGTNFVLGGEVSFWQSGIQIATDGGLAFIDSTEVQLNMPALPDGVYDVVYTNPDTQDSGSTGNGLYTSAFDPLSVGTPKVWLDATDLTQSGTVTAITNKAGGATITITGGQEPGYTSSNSDYGGAAPQPTFDFLSGSPAVKITGHGITTGAGGPFSLVFVADGTDNFWFCDANANNFVTAGGGSGNKLQLSGAGTVLVGGTISSGVPGVYVCVFNGASSKLYTSAHTPDASGDAGAIQDQTGVTFVVGNYGAPSSGGKMAGSIRHFLLYSGALSQDDVDYLLDGFGAAAGITIGA